MAGTFVIIGENVHCTRKVKRGGKRARTLPDGSDVVLFADADGAERHLPVPEPIRTGEAFGKGMIPHVAAAVWLGMHGDDEQKQIGQAYLHWLVRRQVERGADFIDVNVDEISPDPQVRNEAMRWAVRTIQAATDKPLSIDSSQVATLQAGLEAYDAARGGRCMLNSAALERPESIDLAKRFGCYTIVMTSGQTGMPENAEQRIANAHEIIDKCLAAGIPRTDLYVDPLVLPASTVPDACPAVLETIRTLRREYPDVHIAGGHSNVSFGLPMRRLLNAVWLALAMEAGCDSGLIDPLTCHPDDVAKLDRTSEAFIRAKAGFLGQDMFFAEYIAAYREGKLTDPFGA